MYASKTLLASVVLSALLVSGCRTGAQINDVNNALFAVSASTSTRPLTLNDFEQAIINAGANTKHVWTFQRVADGHLEGTLVVRGKHYAYVDIRFDTQKFSINYKDSQNLEYDSATRKIHPNYNGWIRELRAAILSASTALKTS